MTEIESRQGRNGRWWRDYAIRGMTMEAIAERDGVVKSTVSEAIAKVRDSIPEQERAEIRAEIREFYREMRARALEIAEMLPPPVVAGKDGNPVEDPNAPDVTFYDYTGRLTAIKTAADMADRERKMFGVDEASRLIVDNGEDAAAQRLAVESAAFLAQQDREQES